MSRTSDASTKDILIGSALVLFSQLFYGLMDVVIKASDLKIAQYMIGEYSIQLVCAFLWWNLNKPKDTNVNNWYGDKPYVGNIWIRGLLHATSFTTFYATIVLPIGDLQSILYQAPLWIVFLGRVWLKEQLPNIYILIPMTILTYIGIILASQPSFLLRFIGGQNNDEVEPLNIYGVIAIVITVFQWTFSVLLVRKALKSHFLQLDLASSVCCLFLSGPIIMIINEYTKIEEFGNSHVFDDTQWAFDVKAFAVTTFLGVCQFGALSLSVVGYQYGTATTVSWLEYINIPIGFLYQTYVFNDIPNQYEIIGAAMVTVACLMPTIENLYTYLHAQYCEKYELVVMLTSDSELETIDL